MATLSVHGWVAASHADIVTAFPDGPVRYDVDDLDDMAVVHIETADGPVEAVTYDGDPATTILAATSPAAAQAVADHLGQPLQAVAAGCWKVMRQDDNGNTFTVTAGQSFVDATAIAADYEARGHRQTYWVERDRPV